MSDKVLVEHILADAEASDGCSIMHAFAGMGLQEQLKTIADMRIANKDDKLSIGYSVDNSGDQLSLGGTLLRVENRPDGAKESNALFLEKFQAQSGAAQTSFYCETTKPDYFMVGRRSDFFLQKDPILDDNHLYKNREEYKASGDTYLWARGHQKQP